MGARATLAGMAVLHSGCGHGKDGVMPARKPALDVEASEPTYWPIGVDGARIVDTTIRDTEIDLTATFKFGLIPGGTLLILGFSVQSENGISPALRDLPYARWEKTCRGAAERALLTSGPHGQHVAPDLMAELMVDKRFPELKEATGGNALRRRKSLLHLAEMAAEYSEIQGAGISNPAEILGMRYGVSAATVRSWLHRARREGLAIGSSHPNAVPR